jgi:carboxypeptidase Q
MKIRKLYTSLFLLVFIPFMLSGQKENVDLGMVYKIKQEGTRNSTIDQLAFSLTDSVGPRLTGSRMSGLKMPGISGMAAGIT